MEVIGGFVFFIQGRKLLSLDVDSDKLRSHLAHSEEITCIVQSSGVVFTGSVDGSIIKWVLPAINTYKVGSPVLMMCASNSDLYYLKNNSLVLYRLDLASERFESTSYFKGLLEDAVELKLTPGFKDLVLLRRFSIVILNIATQGVRVLDSGVPFNTMSIHPAGDYIAVGDCTGQIMKVYEKYNTKVHWHAHKVQSIGFTNDNNFMLSGGEEGVVVIWHENSTEKSFLPRLGSGIAQVSVNSENNLYVIRLTNGALKVFRTSDHKQVAGFNCLINPAKILPGSKVFCCEFNENKGLVLNSSPGHLQYFDTVSREIKDFDCENRNPILRSNEEYPFPYQIISFAFVSDTLCTLQSSASPYMKIQKLKFWQGSVLTSIILHPHSDTCFSVFSFGSNILSLGQSSFILYSHIGNAWSGIVERGYNSLRPTAGCASHSLFVSFESIITEWDEHLSLTNTLYEPLGESIKEMCCLNEYLIVSTQNSVHIFTNNVIVYTVQLQFIHKIHTKNQFLLIGLNGSPYSPLEIRQSCTNVLLKFDLSSLKLTKAYKTDYPAWYGLDHKGNVLVIDKLFEFFNLDAESQESFDILPKYQKTLFEEPAPLLPSKPTSHFYETSKSSWLDLLKSHELPSAEEFFSNTVLSK